MIYGVLRYSLLLAIAVASYAHTLQITGMTIRVSGSATSVTVVAHTPMLRGTDPATEIPQRTHVRLDDVPFLPAKQSLAYDANHDTVTWTGMSPVRPSAVTVESPVFPEDSADTTVVLLYRDGALIRRTGLTSSHPSEELIRPYFPSLLSSNPAPFCFLLGVVFACRRTKHIVIALGTFLAATTLTISFVNLGGARLPEALSQILQWTFAAATVCLIHPQLRAKLEPLLWISFGCGFFGGFTIGSFLH